MIYFCAPIARWRYRSQRELDGSKHRGVIDSYDGGGFAQNLGVDYQESRDVIDELKRDSWLDRGTRAVFIDFTVYNANINMFCVVRW